MSKRTIIVAAVFLLGYINSVKAEGNLHEVVLTAVAGDLSFGGGSTTVGFGADYNYAVVPDILQFGLKSAVAYSEATATTIAAVLAGPTINFPVTDLRDSFFLTGAFGFTYLEVSSGSTTKFSFGFELGKRFQILENFSYRPAVSITKVSGASMRFGVSLLSFSLII